MEEDQPLYLGQAKRNCQKDLKKIRKGLRQEIFLNRRKKFLPHQQPHQQHEPQQDSGNEQQPMQLEIKKPFRILDEKLESQIVQIMEIPFEQITLEETFKALDSQDILLIHVAVISLRRLVVEDTDNSLTQTILDAGQIPKIISYLLDDAHPQLKLQSAWILANLSAGSDQQSTRIAFHKAHIYLLQVLDRNQEYIVEQAVWAIGNFGAVEEIRDSMLQENVLQRLLDIAQSAKNLKILSYIIWAINNIIGYKPRVDFVTVQPALDFFLKVIKKGYYIQLPEVAKFTIQPLVYYNEAKLHEMITQQDVFQPLMQLANRYFLVSQFRNSIYIIGCLLSTMSSSSTCLCKIAKSKSLIKLCQNVLGNIKKGQILKEYIFFMANLATQPSPISEYFILRETFFQLFTMLLRVVDKSVKIQIIYVLGNAAIHTTNTIAFPLFIKHDINFCFIEFFLSIQNQDNQSLVCILKSFCKIFKLGKRILSTEDQVSSVGVEDKRNIFITQFVADTKVLDKLQEVQQNQNDEVRGCCQNLKNALIANGFGVTQSQKSL